MTADIVFLDANILFSMAYGSEGLRLLWEIGKSGGCELIASYYVIEEAKRNLDQPAHIDTLNGYLTKVRVVPEADPGIPCPIDLPEKDTPVLMAAICAKADFLLTGDVLHFGKYFGQRVMGVRICRPRDYIKGVEKRCPANNASFTTPVLSSLFQKSQR